MSNSNEIYIKTLAAIRAKLSSILSADEISHLEAQLYNLRKTFPDDDDYVDEALDLLEDEFPVLYQEVQAIERIQLPPGDPSHLPPGTVLVCPDGDYEHELRHISEWPVYCPNHGKMLKPKPDISNVP